jgi:hypothetical protein
VKSHKKRRQIGGATEILKATLYHHGDEIFQNGIIDNNNYGNLVEGIVNIVKEYEEPGCYFELKSNSETDRVNFTIIHKNRNKKIIPIPEEMKQTLILQSPFFPTEDRSISVSFTAMQNIP